MFTNNSKEILIKSIILAFVVGAIIPVALLVFDFFYHHIPFSILSFFSLYKLNPIHWFLLPLPILLPILIYFIEQPILKKIQDSYSILDDEVSRSKRILEFTNKLIKDEQSAEYELRDENDKLGKSLINLRDFIRENKIKEQERRNEDEQRHWIAEGLAKFADILRRDNDKLEELSYNVISNLVNYLSANQGGFFILNDNNPSEKYFEMTGCFAYDRKKFADRKIAWGEGLIGTSALERQTILMTDIPDSYMNITSGLGKANPRCLLIVPLKINEEIQGVIELASFENFKPHHVEFTEKVAESIASTISGVKINVRTAKLLKESQNQAEIMAQQEEQMRQNMEELQATQEEAARQAEKFVSFTNSVNHTLIRAEYATDGTLLYANTKFLNKLGYTSNSEVEGQNISMFLNEKDQEWFSQIWENLSKGGRHFEGYMKHVTKFGQDLWTMSTYTCVRKEDGAVDKVLFLAIDNTEHKKQSLDYEGQINALNNSSIKVDYDTFGNIISYNKLFIESLKYTPADLKDKSIFDFIEPDVLDNFKTNWDNIVKGVSFEGQYLFRTKYNEEKWFRTFFSPVFDMYNDVNKIVQISQDITKEKIMEFETKKQNEQLKSQEEKLLLSGIELSKKLDQAKAEMKKQYEEIERIKIRNEKTLEGALDAIVTIDQKSNIAFFNKAAEELWGFNRSEVLNRNVSILFSSANIQENNFINSFVQPSSNKVIGKREEVKITDKNGADHSVLFLLSEAIIGNEHTFTAFIQQIEVELF